MRLITRTKFSGSRIAMLMHSRMAFVVQFTGCRAVVDGHIDRLGCLGLLSMDRRLLLLTRPHRVICSRRFPVDLRTRDNRVMLMSSRVYAIIFVSLVLADTNRQAEVIM